ncbi:hypothetical protein QTP86_015040 [Hemibagrus guttatus]|nr:hypothetical protein QTP86_015040 [Hemibagrus guttatus]
MRIVSTNFIPDQSRPGLTTTAIGAVDLQGAGGNWATVGRRSRGGRRVHRQREKRKGKSVGLRIGTLNVGTMTGKGRELADMMERRKVDILCVQETRWKGSKARSIGAGFKLFYYGVDSKRNGVGVVLKEEFVRNVLEVKRVSDRVMSLKLEIEGVMLNVVSGYAPQVGCELEEKERFWSELDEVMESIPTGERVVIGADFNGEGNTGDEEVMGKFGVKERNLEGQMVVDFAKRMDMAVVNTYFQKREEHRVTYKSGEEEVKDREKNQVVEAEKEECCEEFRQKLRQALGGQVLLPDDWETTAEVIRETGRKVLGVSSGRRKEDKETWWWNEEVQDSIQRKRLAKKKWDMDRTEENRQEYKELQRRVKMEVSKAKQKAYDELYTRLDSREGEKDLYRLARQSDRDGKDVQQVRLIKDRDGRVLTSEESIQRRWKEYFEELMNEENEREKRVEGVNSVEQKVDKIRKDEVRKALKRMKSGKAVGPDDIPVEVWKCLGEAAVEFLTSLFNRVLESEKMPEEWRRNLEKAYDRVPREELWYCMRKSGVAEKYVRVVQDMYERSRTVVRCAVGQIEEFNVEVGLHQGSALSPFLFAIVMDQLSEEVRQESPWTMMFADDIVICSESREQVEENLERWRFALERRGMKVSRSKTEYMCVNEREGSGTVRLQGEEVKKVQEFKYLGSTVQSNGECAKEVKKRVQAVAQNIAMSLFNLERFRYQKEKTGEKVTSSVISPIQEQRRLVNNCSSDKENYLERRVKPDGRRGRGKIPRHALEDVSSDDEACKKARVPAIHSSARSATECEKQTGLEMEDKLAKLLEMFPRRNRSELLEVVKSTSTLEGAVAYCLVAYKDKDLSKSKGSTTHGGDAEMQPKKRRKTTESAFEPESEEDNDEPNREKQDALVHKLKKKFPKMDKEVLRDLLRGHEWDFKNALGSLLMFSSESDSSPGEIEKTTSEQSSHSKPSKSRQESSEEGKQKPDSSSLTRWLSAVSNKSPSRPLSSSHRSTSRESKIVSHKYERAKTEKIKPKQNKDTDSELDSEAEDDSDSEFDLEGEDNSFDPGVQEQILQFFQEASVDELTLISGCSLKKAQKIISLRPFNTWEDVNKQFCKDNGLSMELVHGCRDVLRERQVLKQLMNKCESIARKMTKDISQVIENGMGSMKQPTTLNSKLKLQPYQLIGLKWLILLHQHNLSGILADEMGLGKTIQAISFLAHLYQKGIKGPHLITVPSSTVDNWVRELELWCPSLKVIVYYGSVEDRKYLRHDILNNQVEFNVIVSTYNLTIGNENDRSLFRKLKLQCAVFDEGHMLKNMNSLRYRHLMAINAEQRLLLTGTPLQNNLLELISLLNFIMPSMFSSSTSQISKMFSTKSSEEESSFHKERIAQAKLIMKPFILRRVKSEVLKELPPKLEKIEMCPMSDAQQQLYDGLFHRLKKAVNGEKRELSNVMMQLRKMANHPLLHRQYYTTEKLAAMSRAMLKEPTHFDADPALIQEDMGVMSDFELHNLCKEYSSISKFQLEKELLLDSGKFSLLTKLLAKLEEQGDRVVLFSQFTMMLDIVEILLKHLGHQYVRLDGSTPLADRIGLIDKYNTDSEIFVFLLSTRAGGQGINLASANVVILHDIDCNPFNDKQAEDRCHRMGQRRAVQVIKLISKDSIEACMLRAGQEKLKLEQDMTTDDGEEGSMSEDVAELLKGLYWDFNQSEKIQV